jgi:glycosyltransferase involved in cell wall biosynthesis
MRAAPQMTVLMPVRNGARWLAEAIESVLGQTLSDLELLVVDDGSTDATPTILAGYADRDSRVHVLRQEPEGLVAALNRGLAVARAPLVARLDADDAAAPQRLELQHRFLERRPGVCLVGTWAQCLDEHGHLGAQLRPATDSDRLAQLLLQSNPFIHSSVIFRADVARDLGGYRPAFQAAEDYDLWLRISQVGAVANIGESLVRYRVHKSSVTNRRAIRQAFSARLALQAHRIRRTTGQDAASHLTGPPDWWAKAAEDAFYAGDAQIYRILELADRSTAARADLSRIDLTGFFAQIPQLNHRERKLAQLALVYLIRGKRHGHLRKVELLRQLIRLHPARAVRLALSSV